MTNQIEHFMEPMEPLRPLEPLPPIPSEGTAMTMAHHKMPYADEVHIAVRRLPYKNRVNGDRAPVTEAEPVFAVDLGVINQGVDRNGNAWVRRLWYLSKPHRRNGKDHRYVYTKTAWYADRDTVMVYINPTDVHGTRARRQCMAEATSANPVEVLMEKLDVGTVMSVDDAPLDVLGQIEADRRMADWREQRPGAEHRPSKARGRVATGVSAMWGDTLLRVYLCIGAILLAMAWIGNVVQPNPVASSIIAMVGGGLWFAAFLIAGVMGYFAEPSRRR